MIKAIKPKARKGVWGWTWRIALLLAGIVVVLFGMLVAWYLYDTHKAKVFAARPQGERNLIVYDAFTKIIETEYYDPAYGGVDWKAAVAAERPKAAAAKSPVALYNTVLFPMAARIPSSHVAVTFTGAARSSGAHVADDDQKKPFPVNGEQDFGFDWIPLQRAHSKFVVVGDVRRGSEAEAAGVEPGWLLSEGSATPVYDEKHGWRAHFKGSFVPIVADHAHYSYANGQSKLEFKSENAERVQLRQLEFYGIVTPPPSPFETRQLKSGALYSRFNTFGDNDFNAKVMDQVIAAIDARRNSRRT